MNLLDQYENEEIFVNEFFKAKKKWVSQFCESWIRILKDSFRSIKFYETVKKYRIESKTYFDEMKDSSRRMSMVNVATLQGQDQNQQQQPQNSIDNQRKGKSKSLKK